VLVLKIKLSQMKENNKDDHKKVSMKKPADQGLTW
jgi:hypothetical protein